MNEAGGEQAPLLTTPPPVTPVTGACTPRVRKPENFRQAQKVNCPNGARESPLEGVLPKLIDRFLSLNAEESVSPGRSEFCRDST